MKKISVLFKILIVGLIFPLTIMAQTRNDAGLRGDAGAVSGFFETMEPVNYPVGTHNWWHLLDVRHSVEHNNYAMQFAGSFFNQQLFFRKTIDNPSQPWSKVLLEIDGKVGIGTDDTRGYQLAVMGKVRAHEIKVENSTWPDYVFEKSYQLPSLHDTENHIKEKGHLPGIPSAAEVKVNGIDLGEMNAKLLQKIEELTLYLIEKDKRDKEQQLKIEQLQKQVSAILAKDK